MILLFLLTCASGPKSDDPVDGAGGGATDTAPHTPDDTGEATDDTGEAMDDTAEPPPIDLGLVALEAPRLLRRMSLDIRGLLPSTDDLDRVEADPAAIIELRDTYLTAEGFTDRFVSLLNERWHTQVDSFNGRQIDYGFPINDEYAFERSIGDEPLRLMAWVASHDLPWTETVTADYTIANRYLAGTYALDTEIDDESWTLARYTDGRPSAGVLSTNGLWWRYYTTSSNMNRARAAAISDLLLCKDFLALPVAFSAVESVADEDGTSEAVRTEPACLACHASLDPLASTLFGFWWNPLESAAEIATYHPEREPLGPAWLQVEPAYFGVPVMGLADVATLIAADPRFERCAVETMTSLYWRRPVTPTDVSAIDELENTFIDGDLRMHTLIGAVMDSEVYRAGSFAEHATPETRAREETVRMLSPDQLSSSIEQVSGFEWTWRGYDQLANDELGFRILGGGVDGAEVFTPQASPSVSWALVVWRLAQAGAAHAVDHDLSTSVSPRLFQHADIDAAPGDAEFDAELNHLHWALFARRADAIWLDGATALWAEIEARSGTEAAWAALLTTMLSDPEYVSY